MRTHSIAALVLAAILALSACSDDDPDPGDPMSTWTPSGTPDAPSSSATPSADPTEPPLPDAAREATEAGARAFITYYWDLINYAQVTGDVKALREVSGPNCNRCRAGIDAIAALYRSGGRLTDGRYRASIVSMKAIDRSERDLLVFESKTKISNDDHKSIQSDGSEEVFEASTITYFLYLLWVDDRWRVDVMERA